MEFVEEIAVVRGGKGKNEERCPGPWLGNLSQSERVKRICCKENKFGVRPFESEVTVSHTS